MSDPNNDEEFNELDLMNINKLRMIFKVDPVLELPNEESENSEELTAQEKSILRTKRVAEKIFARAKLLNMVDEIAQMSAEEFMAVIIAGMIEDYNANKLKSISFEEKKEFAKNVAHYIDGRTGFRADAELIDFFKYYGIIPEDIETREEKFVDYLLQKYGTFKDMSVLEVDAGKHCELARLLAQMGNKVTAMGMGILTPQSEAKKLGLNLILVRQFYCDEYARNGRGTQLKNYEHIVSIQPYCTEHIIRQGLNANKPFDIELPAVPSLALNGRTFGDVFDWYEYLLHISSEINIDEYAGRFYASNQNFNQPEMEKTKMLNLNSTECEM